MRLSHCNKDLEGGRGKGIRGEMATKVAGAIAAISIDVRLKNVY